MPDKRSRTAEPHAFQLKIQLIAIKPAIWRRVLVPTTFSFQEMHAVFQGAMGWQDSHLHMFEISKRRFLIPEDDGFGLEGGCEDERKQVPQALLSKGMKFEYIYDFGDEWRHRVTVEDTNAPAGDRYLPICTAGARACPPEDCGGLNGYPELLEAIADPEHERHEHLAEWVGDFDPEAFSVAQANNSIKAICALYRERGWGFRQGSRVPVAQRHLH